MSDEQAAPPFSIDAANRTRDAVRYVERSTGNRRDFKGKPNFRAACWTWVKLTRKADGYGKYYARIIYFSDSDVDPTIAPDLSDLGDVDDSDDEVLVVNLREAGQTTWLLWSDSDAPAQFGCIKGVNADGRVVVVLNGFNPATFPVLVAVDGGVAGDPSTTCTLTYSVTDLDGNALGATLTPDRTRHENCQYDSVADGSIGLGYIQGGAFKLYDVAGEKPTGDVITIQDQQISGLDVQVRTRDILVLEATDWSDWGTFDSGTECVS